VTILDAPAEAESDLPWTEEHRILRASALKFFETECASHQNDWELAGGPPRSLWVRAGELGYLLPCAPTEYGGLGADFLFSVILAEEQARAGVVAPVLSLQSDVIAPYLIHYGTEAQQRRFLPSMAAGATVAAVATTEGSDELAAVETTAKRDGEGYRITGRKTFVTHGVCADLVLTAAQTEPGVSLFLVEAEAVGLSRQKVAKLGNKAVDTADLTFDDVRVPADSLLGGEAGRGSQQHAERAIQERLLAGIASAAAIDRALALTIDYVKNRMAFGRRILDFQNTRFKLAEAKTEARVLRVFLDRCIAEFMDGRLDAPTSAALKYWAAERQSAIVDDCVQLHGGYGYILDYPIARMWVDGRISKLHANSERVIADIRAAEI
jgi:alkylation response protein AidB-like acyl-CoA dehydrogenase